MTRDSKFRVIQVFIMNRLLLIVIALMIASIFSVLLIKGHAFTGRQPDPEPQRVSLVTCPGAKETQPARHGGTMISPTAPCHAAASRWRARL